jgi:hypothetical protein
MPVLTHGDGDDVFCHPSTRVQVAVKFQWRTWTKSTCQASLEIPPNVIPKRES